MKERITRRTLLFLVGCTMSSRTPPLVGFGAAVPNLWSRNSLRRLFSPRSALLRMFAGIVLLSARPAAALAQEATALAGSREVPSLQVHRSALPIRIDGRLGEDVWTAAPVASGFVQGEPIEGAPAQQQTEVRVLYDEQALYVGARMYDDSPDRIARQLVRRDETGQFDFFELSLDTNLDLRTGYVFQISAAGVQGDSYLFDDVREDRSWNAVWESAVQVDEKGWTAELRIPLSQIRYLPSLNPQDWGINFTRRRVASNERSYFSLESRRRYGRVSAFGRLRGLELARGVSRLELRPYVLTRGRAGPTEDGNPFQKPRDANASAGLDARYGIGANFTLDVSVNPDFGQVEVDPAVINLSAFEIFYPERRPFFVEDARIFDFGLSGGQNSLFYSRRIGRRPQRSSLGGASFVDVAEQTSILGAMKLTGRTARGLSVGVLGALTGREEGQAYFARGDSLKRFLAEPRSEYAVVGAQQELRGGATVVGGMLSMMHRDLPGDRSLDFLPSGAAYTGVNFQHTWKRREWAFWGFLAGSYTAGSEEAIIRLQRGPNHFRQRPDASGLGVDSSATRLTGAEWRLQLERRSGQHWTGAVWAAQRTPGFEVNDVGYFQGSERLDGGMRISYQEITPGRVLRNYRLTAVTFHNWRHEALREPFSYTVWGDAHKAGSISANADMTFLNFWGLSTGLSYGPEVRSEVPTRGGPLMLIPSRVTYSLRANTDRRARLTVSPAAQIMRSTPDGWSSALNLEIGYRPSPGVNFEVEPSFARERDPRQYVTVANDRSFTPTFGQRFVFADVDRTTFSLGTRLNVTFTPHLTLQLFAQPLLSAGDFVAYKQFSQAGTDRFDPFEEGTAVPAGTSVRCVGGRTCRDGNTRFVDFQGDGVSDVSFRERAFRVRSLRGNSVLRWEYRPGSTLFLVWQQARHFEDGAASEFRLRQEFGRLLGEQPDNVLILKMNYWLSL
jgi:hypothetical protein